MNNGLEHDIYVFFLKSKMKKQHYLRFYMWRKIFKFHFSKELKSDYYIRKIFIKMYNLNLFIKKNVNKKNDYYKINTFRIEEEDLGYISFD